MDVKQFEGSTPGPWKKIKDDMGWTIFAPNAVSTFDSRTKVVCVLPNHELDATLIAAAPDLLKENQSLRSELQKQKELNAEGWILSRQRMPEYDGFYYVYGFQHHACGNVTPFHMIVECRMNQWVKSDIGYQMTCWRQLLEPPKMESDEY